MSYQSDINDAILASAPLAALIGDRFAWDITDGATATPYLVAYTIGGKSETSHDGDRSLCFDLIQISAWASTKAGAITLAKTIKEELEGRTLPGDSNVTLTYEGGQSTYDQDTEFSGEIIEYRVSAFTN